MDHCSPPDHDPESLLILHGLEQVEKVSGKSFVLVGMRFDPEVADDPAKDASQHCNVSRIGQSEHDPPALKIALQIYRQPKP